jgi:hypothetical protein
MTANETEKDREFKMRPDAIAAAKRMLEKAEPAPVEVASYRRRAGDIIARAMRSFYERRSR